MTRAGMSRAGGAADPRHRDRSGCLRGHMADSPGASRPRAQDPADGEVNGRTLSFVDRASDAVGARPDTDDVVLDAGWTVDDVTWWDRVRMIVRLVRPGMYDMGRGEPASVA